MAGALLRPLTQARRTLALLVLWSWLVGCTSTITQEPRRTTTGAAELRAASDANTSRKGEAVRDADQDGVPDAADRCPDAKEDGVCLYKPDPGGELGLRWSADGCCHGGDGCPDLDPDADGIAAQFDKCPREPETWNERHDGDGCPDTAAVETDYVLARAAQAKRDAMMELLKSGGQCNRPVIVEGSEIISFEPVEFLSERGTITSQGSVRLDAAAAMMKRNPEFLYVEVAGHTGQGRSAAHSLALSQRQAEMIRKQLIRRGVEPERLGARGYGKYCLQDKDSGAHIDLKVVATKDGETGVQRGCDAARKHGILPLEPPPVPARDVRSEDGR